MTVNRNPDGFDSTGGESAPVESTSTSTPEVSTQVEAAPVETATPTEPAAPIDWRAMELPPQAHVYGKTTGDLVKRYQDSSREGQRLRSEVQRYQAEIAKLQKPQSAPTQQQASPQNNYFGFGSVEAYNRAWDADPQGVMQKVTRFSLQQDPSFLRELVDPLLQERLKPYEEREQAATFSARAEAYHAAHPEIRANPVYLEAAQNYANEHADEIMALHQAYPDLNLTEYVCERALAPIYRQELEAFKKNKTTQRAGAATATSAGARTVPKDTSSVEGMAAKIYEANRQAGTAMTYDDALAEVRAMRGSRIFPTSK